MNDWIELSTEEDFNNLLERSVKKPQIIFKDSVTCGISAYAKEWLFQQYDLLQGKADFNYLDWICWLTDQRQTLSQRLSRLPINLRKL